MKQYAFSVIAIRRLMRETVIGVIDEETARAYVKDFKVAARPLLGKPWALLTDLTQWKTSKPEVVVRKGTLF